LFQLICRFDLGLHVIEAVAGRHEHQVGRPRHRPAALFGMGWAVEDDQIEALGFL
jgi:hypothetical protein